LYSIIHNPFTHKQSQENLEKVIHQCTIEVRDAHHPTITYDKDDGKSIPERAAITHLFHEHDQ
ncbi:hypothetical protein BS47DRAFT_1293631, partial [Hydnum rufescens UP504]